MVCTIFLPQHPNAGISRLDDYICHSIRNHSLTNPVILTPSYLLESLDPNTKACRGVPVVRVAFAKFLLRLVPM